jgi:hypothetical protein
MSRPYFQFPLCALNLPESETSRLNRIIEFCCVDVGKHMWAKLSDPQRDNLRLHPPPPLQMNEVFMRDARIQALLGAQRLNVTLGGVSATIEGYEILLSHVRNYEHKVGGDGLVRLVTTFVFDARDGQGLSYLELAVLAAIYSKIGAADGPIRISRAEIWRRAHGYKSKKAFSTICRHPWLAERKTRSAIEALRERGFFAHATYGRRETYYSHRLSLDQLVAAIVERKTHKVRVRHKQIEANHELTNKIRDERHKLATRRNNGAPPDASLVPVRLPLK